MLIRGVEIDGEGLRALAAAARAFERAKKQGHVWLTLEGFYESHEGTLNYEPAEPKNPLQLTLDA